MPAMFLEMHQKIRWTNGQKEGGRGTHGRMWITVNQGDKTMGVCCSILSAFPCWRVFLTKCWWKILARVVLLVPIILFHRSFCTYSHILWFTGVHGVGMGSRASSSSDPCLGSCSPQVSCEHQGKAGLGAPRHADSSFWWCCCSDLAAPWADRVPG